MYFLQSHFSAGTLCLFFVIVSITIVYTVFFLLRRFVNYETFKANHEVFAATSLIYSLVLAFVIVAVWNDYEELNNTIEKETDKLSDILVHGEELPDSIAGLIRASITGYSQMVIKNEWETEGRKRNSDAYLQQLRQSLFKFLPAKNSEQKVLDVIDDDLSTVSDLRRERLSHNHSHVPGLVWMILIAGTIITTVCSYLFFVEPKRLHYLFIGLLNCMIAMSLFLVYMLDHPFNGSSAVSKEPYEMVIESARAN